jgi:hypothetical protein
VTDPQKQKSSDKLCWVSGTLRVSEACGDLFSFSVRDFGKAYLMILTWTRSIKQALAVCQPYLVGNVFCSTMHVWSGFVKNRLPPPVPSPGSCWMIGTKVIALSLCASPIPCASPFSRRNQSQY